MATATYTVADAKTDPVAITFKWRTLLPTDVAAATLADLGGAHQTGTGSIAANASPRQAQFSVTTTPNTTFEGDRSFDVEIYDATPAGTTLTVSKVRTKIVEDDAAPSTNIYGPTTTADTGSQTVGSATKYKMSGVLGGTAWKLYFGSTETDGTPGHVIEPANSDNYRMAPLAADGTQGTDNNFTYRPGGGVAGTAYEIIHDRTANTLSVIIGGQAPYVRGISNAAGGPFFRGVLGGASGTMTVTAVS